MNNAICPQCGRAHHVRLTVDLKKLYAPKQTGGMIRAVCYDCWPSLAPPRRQFRFSLRMLFAIVTLAAIASGVARACLHSSTAALLALFLVLIATLITACLGGLAPLARWLSAAETEEDSDEYHQN